ncbi:MAG: PQQ-binding-like beta-propeller repeat protein [Alphaproteobacteria bacterium]|nr:PQQ-binding-like beta-propeller repeat protein [Alphaproteobacteria bacterium]
MRFVNISVLLLMGTFVPAKAQDWMHYGGDAGGSKYSEANQITPENVADLEVTWTFRHGELAEHPRRAFSAAWHATPLLLPEEAGGHMAVCTPMNRIVALDPTTGEQRWVFDPAIELGPIGTRYNCRGLELWKDSQAEDGNVCAWRLFMGTGDLRLLAIDANTGAVCSDFGTSGAVDLSEMIAEGVEDFWYGGAQLPAPPVTVGDIVVIGTSNNMRTYGVNTPRGTVRAFDARSGAPVWTFDPIPYDPADPLHETWTPEALEITTGANAWTFLSVDEARDLVFVPTGSASPDPFGGYRPGDNRYANSVIALRGLTGEVVWHFQTIHHDVWDWDLPAQPMLVDISRDGEVIPALVQLTKQGLVFVLHRETGEPIFGVEERPVPTDGAVPGEVLSPTQPFPVKPPPLIKTGITPDDAWGFTFWDEGKCREEIANLNYGPLFTPPTAKGSATSPGLSVTNWGGGAYDAATNTLVTTATKTPFKIRVFPADQLEPYEGPPQFGVPRPIAGTPYAFSSEPILSPLGNPCIAPPWAEVVTLDLGEGTIKWRSPLGTIDKLAPVPIPLKLGTPTSGGPIVTAGGLIFIGATMDERVRAFDLKSGDELWVADTPTAAMATPMTYVADGKQYVAIVAAGHLWQYPQNISDWLIVYALPD